MWSGGVGTCGPGAWRRAHGGAGGRGWTSLAWWHARRFGLGPTRFLARAWGVDCEQKTQTDFLAWYMAWYMVVAVGRAPRQEAQRKNATPTTGTRSITKKRNNQDSTTRVKDTRSVDVRTLRMHTEAEAKEKQMDDTNET